MARLWREHRLLVLAFGLALAVTLFFAVRTALFWTYWSDPARRDLDPRGWMTIGFVERSWHLERGTLAEAMGLVRGEGPRTLAQIAAERGVPLSQVEAEVKAAIAAARDGK